MNNTRRNGQTLQAFDPDSGNTHDVTISFERLHTISQRGMGHTKECCFTVPAILLEPNAIFEGIRSDEDEYHDGNGWRCYCGIPRCAYYPDGAERAAYPGKVYLIFINHENVVYNWRWDLMDPDNYELPKNHKIRFEKRLTW